MPIRGAGDTVTIGISVGGRVREVRRDADFRSTIAKLITEAGWELGILKVDGRTYEDFPPGVNNFEGLQEVVIEKYTKVGQ